jgi:hypothetical protein
VREKMGWWRWTRREWRCSRRFYSPGGGLQRLPPAVVVMMPWWRRHSIWARILAVQDGVDAREVVGSSGLVVGVRARPYRRRWGGRRSVHSFAVTSMRRRKNEDDAPTNRCAGLVLSCGLGQCWAVVLDCTVGCTARWAPFLFSLLFSVYNSVFYFLFEFHIWILLLLQVSQLLILSGSNILIIRLLIYLNKHFIWASIAYLWSLFKMLNRHELILSF